MKYEIPWEAAEAIVKKSLEEDYRMSREELDNFYRGKSWMHPEDVEGTVLLLSSLKELIKYYGGSID